MENLSSNSEPDPQEYAIKYQGWIKQKVKTSFPDVKISDLEVLIKESFTSEEGDSDLYFYVRDNRTGLNYGVTANTDEDNNDAPCEMTCAQLY